MLTEHNKKLSKPVHVVELDEIFESIGEAARKLNLYPSSIRRSIITGKKYKKMLTFKELTYTEDDLEV